MVQAKRLYEKILECVNLKKGETVIHLYCGTGTIPIYMANKAKRMYGIEVEERAIRDAEINSKLNNISNIRFFSRKAGEWR